MLGDMHGVVIGRESSLVKNGRADMVRESEDPIEFQSPALDAGFSGFLENFWYNSRRVYTSMFITFLIKSLEIRLKGVMR